MQNLCDIQRGLRTASLFLSWGKGVYNTIPDNLTDKSDNELIAVASKIAVESVTSVASIVFQSISLPYIEKYLEAKAPSIAKIGFPSISASLAAYSFTKILLSESTSTFHKSEEKSKVAEAQFALVGTLAIFALEAITKKASYIDLLAGALFGSLVAYVNHSIDSQITYDFLLSDEKYIYDDA